MACEYEWREEFNIGVESIDREHRQLFSIINKLIVMEQEEKDIEWTAQLIQEILDSIGTIGDFTKSKLYQHMALKTVDSNFSASLKRELLKSLEDESFHYMQGNEDWEKLKSDVYS